MTRAAAATAGGRPAPPGGGRPDGPGRRRRRGGERRRDSFVLGLVLLALVVAAVAAASLLSPHDPTAQRAGPPLASPSWEHPLGTDDLGRDVLARTLHGGRTVLSVALAAVALAAVAGTALGTVAGYFRGALDTTVSRVMDVMLSFPLIILAIMIVVILGPGLSTLVAAIAVSQVPVFTRLARSLALSLREAEFVQAVRALGGGHRHILLRHLVPNMAPIVAVQAGTTVGLAILAATALNYLGFGVQPPTPDWGALVSDYQRFVFSRPWLPIVPGGAIAVTVLALNLASDGLSTRIRPPAGL